MIKYKNLGRNSNIDSYEIYNSYILVKFKKSTKIYSYSYQKAGRDLVENMKKLAILGKGLNSYINKYVRDLYD